MIWPDFLVVVKTCLMPIDPRVPGVINQAQQPRIVHACRRALFFLPWDLKQRTNTTDRVVVAGIACISQHRRAAAGFLKY